MAIRAIAKAMTATQRDNLGGPGGGTGGAPESARTCPGRVRRDVVRHDAMINAAAASDADSPTSLPSHAGRA